MKNLSLIAILTTTVLVVTSCTFNFSMSHTSGGSTETMDDTASQTPTVSPTLNVPVSAIPGVK